MKIIFDEFKEKTNHPMEYHERTAFPNNYRYKAWLINQLGSDVHYPGSVIIFEKQLMEKKERQLKLRKHNAP